MRSPPSLSLELSQLLINATTPQRREQFRAAKENAEAVAPQCVNGDKQRPTPFGEVFDELPNDVDELDAIIEDLKEDLLQSESNPQVVGKYEKVK